MWNVYVKIFLIVVVIQCALTKSNIEPASCCSGSLNLISNRTCVNGTKTLICEHGSFIIDPSFDKDDFFQITNDGQLFMPSTDTYVDHGEYCVTKIETNPTANDTREVGLVCFEEPKGAVMFMVKGSLALLSVAFLIFTLYVYYIVPDLRETQDKITICAISCITTFFFFLAINQLFTDLVQRSACTFVAFIIYYFALAYFAWLNMVMANVWKVTVMRRWKINERIWYGITHVYGWGIPISLTIIALIGHHSEIFNGPDFGINSCWFSDNLLTWAYMYIPMTIMLCINTVFFIWSCIALHMQGKDISPDKLKALSYKLKLYVSLFLLSGLTWIFEVLSYHFESKHIATELWIITDIINSLQGALIAFILVFWRKRVRRALASKRICCCFFPSHWSQFKDTEEDILHEEDTE